MRDLKYIAFMSYRRANAREAYRLRNRLHSFYFPIKLVQEENRPPNSSYIYRIALDKSVLNPGVDFFEEIKKTIDQSRFLIVMCSRETVASPIIEKEIEYFLETRGEDAIKYIIPVIVNGTPNSGDENECLPRPLRERYGQEIAKWNLPTMFPSPGESESIAWENATVLTAAYILRVDRDSLYNEFLQIQRRALRIRMLIASVVLLGFFLLSVFAVYNWIQADYAKRQETLARKQETLARKKTVETLALSDFQEAVRIIEDKQDMPGGLVWLGGALAEDYCVPAAQRLFGLLAQRSWLVEREVATDRQIEAQRDLLAEQQKIIETSWKSMIIPGETTVGFAGANHTKWKCSLIKQKNENADMPQGSDDSSNNTDSSVGTFEIVAIDEPKIVISPNREYFYVVYKNYTTDYSLECRRLKDMSVVRERNFDDCNIRDINISPDGIHLVLDLPGMIEGKENRYLVLDSYSLMDKLEISLGYSVLYLSAFSFDSRLLAVCIDNKRLEVYDLWNARLATESKSITGFCGEIGFTSDDRCVLLAELTEKGKNIRQYEIQASSLSPREYITKTGFVNNGYLPVPGTDTILIFSLWGTQSSYCVGSYDFSTGHTVPSQRLKIKIPMNESLQSCNSNIWSFAASFLDNGSQLVLLAKVADVPRLLIFDVNPKEAGDCQQWKLNSSVDLPYFYGKITISPDKRYLAMAEPPQKGEQDSLYVYDLLKKCRVEDLIFPDWATDAAFSTDNTMLIAVGIGESRLWEYSDEQWHLKSFAEESKANGLLKKIRTSANWSSDRVLGLTHKGEYTVFDPRTEKIILDISEADYAHTCGVAFSPCGQYFAYCPTPTAIIVCNTADGRPITPQLEHKYTVKEMKFFKDDNQIILCSRTDDGEVNTKSGFQAQGKIEIWSIDAKRRISDLIPVDKRILYMDIDSEGSLVYGISPRLIKTPVITIESPQTPEEEKLLQKLLPVICQKYGGGKLNPYRAPEWNTNPQKELEEFCQTLSLQEREYPSIKPWLELDHWISAPLEKRFVMPGSNETLLDYLKKHAKEEPERCLAIDPTLPVAVCEWIDKTKSKIAENDYVLADGNNKKFSPITLQREMDFIEKQMRNYQVIYNNPRVRFFADYATKMAMLRTPESIELLNLRATFLEMTGQVAQAVKIREKVIELLD